MEKTINNDQVQLLIKKNEISEDRSIEIQEKFKPFLIQVESWKSKAEALVVTDISQEDEMNQAREGRLMLKKIRVEADKTRKDLKEDSLKFGRVVQGIFNVIESQIKPIEDHLLQQEQFKKRIEDQERKERGDARLILLQDFNEFVPSFMLANIADMPDEDFTKLLNGSKLQFEVQQEKLERDEKERIAILEEQDIARKAEAERLKQIKEENERLKEQEEINNRIRKEAEDEIKRLEEEKAEEKRQKELIEQKKKEETEALLKAPDKEKLIKLIATIENIKFPEKMQSTEGKKCVLDVMNLIDKVSFFIANTVSKM